MHPTQQQNDAISDRYPYILRMRRGFFAMRAPLSLSAESTLGDLLSRLDDGMELLSAAMAREKF